MDQPGLQLEQVLAYCGLGIEEACLNFHQTRRPVRTASAGQVRKPIYKQALQHWKHFETQLGPLKQALEQSPD